LPHDPEAFGPKRIPEAVLMYQSPDLPRLEGGATVPSYQAAASFPAGPVGPGVPVSGAQADPLQTRQCPATGAVAEIARPCNWVAFPLEAEDVE
jgi:hypothetical protein